MAREIGGRVDVRIFKTAEEFRQWLTKNHASTTELFVAHYKKTSGKVSMTYAEAVDEALCFGWIDGVVRKIDDEVYGHRFTPRKADSIWSLVNIKHVERLTAAGKMMPAGIAAYAARRADKTGIYSFEQTEAIIFSAAQLKQFKANQKAWTFWQPQPPGYKRTATFYVTSAKREETQQKRLAMLIDSSEKGLRLAEVAGKKRDKDSTK
jgi:uncharacterized protein YdeI (YjbR/CyaY-like superfamily)